MGNLTRALFGTLVLVACGHEDGHGDTTGTTPTDATGASDTLDALTTATTDATTDDATTTTPTDATTTTPTDATTSDATADDATTTDATTGPTDTAVVGDIAATGLDERPSNTSCLAFARPDPGAGGDVQLVRAFPNMDFGGRAIGLRRARFGPGQPLRWFVLDRDGLVWTFVDAAASKDGLAADGSPVERAEVFLDLPDNVYGASGEGGLLGFDLDPDAGVRADAGYIYVHYTTWPDNNVWRFRVTRGDDGWQIAEQKRVFVTASGGGNHWGGDLAFGPDGYLYVSLGDGGNGMNASDARKATWLRGKILRIDPRAADADTAYVIPPGNPYAGNPLCDDRDLEDNTIPCPEIFALGFRNPWRMSFDRDTGYLLLGDVGSGKEEIDLVVAGHDYGWNACDGVNPTASCPPTNAASTRIAPVAQYRHYGSASVAGGYVYRGTALGTALQGAYLFTDVYGGELLVIRQPYTNVTLGDGFRVNATLEHPDEDDADDMARFDKIAGIDMNLPVSFAEDEHAELYVVTFGSGRGQAIWKLVPPTAPPEDPVPARLSQTGCVRADAPWEPAPGLIPYALNAPFWSDGADKERWLALPDGATIMVGADGDWDLPIGSVVMKRFALGGQRIETRLMVRHEDGGWAGYSYVWRADQSDADAANPEGESRAWGGEVWRYPSRPGCMSCHTTAAGGTLGLETRQLNRLGSYPSTGRAANQIDTLAHIGMFTTSPGDGADLPAFVSPWSDAPLGERARVYLHANCAQCHRAGRVPDLKFWTELPATGLCAEGRLVPGDPDASLVVQRMTDPDPTRRMPLGGGHLIDDDGVDLVRAWIDAMTSCP